MVTQCHPYFFQASEIEPAFDKKELNCWKENELIKADIDNELRAFVSSNRRELLDQVLDPELSRILSLDSCFVVSYLTGLANS